MSRICEVTGKAGLVGNMVSHSNRKKLMKQLPNLQKKRFYIPEEDRWVTLRVSAAGLRTINKVGIETIVQELGDEVLPAVRKTPVFAGVCGTDPFRKMDMFLGTLKEQGFNGVQNFPTVGIVDGRFRANMEGTNMGYQLEVDMIRTAHELDLFTCPFVFDAEQGEAMAHAGADMLLLHFGLVTKKALERGDAPSVESCADKLRQVWEKCRAVRRDILIGCCGQQVDSLEGAAQLVQSIPSVAGFFIFFPGKGEELEKGLTTKVREYRSLDKMKRAALQRTGAGR